MSVPTFVVGTGRCGSTMLSDMLREHPKVLSVSEFFALITDLARKSEPFSSEPVTGAELWDIVAAPTPWINFALRHQVTSSEWLYPFEKGAARFSLKTGIPSISVTTLPYLTCDPDALFDLLKLEANTWAAAPIGDQYKRLFGWMVRHFDKQIWVERSGGGLLMVGPILATFPDARFIHIVRDGRDASASMREHLVIQFALLMSSIERFLGVDPIASDDRCRIGDVPEDLRVFLPECFDVDAFKAFRFPSSLYGKFWSEQIADALKILAKIPPDRLLTLRYENFFNNATRQLDTLAAFLGDELVDHEWSARCAATVRSPRSTWHDLPEAEIDELNEVCRPGFEVLREVGVEYDI